MFLAHLPLQTPAVPPVRRGRIVDVVIDGLIAHHRRLLSLTKTERLPAACDISGAGSNSHHRGLRIGEHVDSIVSQTVDGKREVGGVHFEDLVGFQVLNVHAQ